MATVIDVQERRAPAPISTAWIWSRLSFSFVNFLVSKGTKKELDHEDLPSVPEEDHASVVTDACEKAWNDPSSNRSLWRVIYTVFMRAYWTSGFWCFAESVTRISQPVLLGFFLDWLTSSESDDVYAGLMWAGSIAFVAFVQALIHHQLYYDTMKLGWNVRIAMSGLIHRKMLRLHSAAASSSGKIVNLVSNDTMRFDNFFPRLHFGWSGPMDFLVVFAIMVHKVGWLATFAGTSVVFLSFPVTLYFGRQLATRRAITARWTDERVRMTTEILEGILSVKSFCWGKTLISNRVEKLRGEERSSIFRAMLMKSFNEAVSFATPYIATLMTFLTFWLQGETLDVAIVFSTMSLIHVLRISIGKNLFYFIETFPEVCVSIRRMREFLLLPEYTSPPRPAANKTHQQRVILKNASFAWGLDDSMNEKKEKTRDTSTSIEMTSPLRKNKSAAVLRGVNMQLADGELVIVCGPTGCGKSALLRGILGEIRCTQGICQRTKHVAVVNQEPWILAGTVRDNIVWSSTFDQRKYDEILRRCQLDEDVATLSDGDLTEIGEKGVNLSGGQRARVALARACYADANLYLLDDPLSAVDPNVSRRLFNDVVFWLSKERNKSVVLVTHHRHFSSYADRVLCLGLGGDVESYKSISRKEEKKDNDSSSKRVEHQEEKEEEKEDMGMKEKIKDPVALVLKEERTHGDVSTKTYLTYLSSGGLPLVFVLVLLFTGGQVAAIMSDVTLEVWSTKSESEQENPNLFYTFLALTLTATVAGFVRAALFFFVGLKASSTIHTKALTRVVRSPMSWFISNPVGRIINKFSSDLGQIDELLPVTLLQCLTGVLLCIGAIILSCVAIPYLAIAVVPLSVVMMYVRWYFLCSSRALKRLDAISKSPVFVAFNGNLSGRSTIRAYEASEFTRDDFEKRLEANARAWYHWLLVNRWVGFRLDMVTWIVLSLVVFGGAFLGSEGNVEAGLFAIAITYCIQLSGVFQYMVRLSARVEVMMTSVERLDYYCNLESEERDDNDDVKTWSPHSGEIDLRSICVKYREDLPTILKHVNAKIPAGSKVGVIGRTGSGKSSLILAMCRLNMITEGKILIDGKDTASVNLKSLRSCVGVIPQRPVLFTGSLRENVDPTLKFSDQDILEALQSVHLSKFLQERGGLDMTIRESGSNLSVGQRQLISLARALLLKRKIYVVDEATANIDMETDKLIQDMIRSHPVFRSATILTIAHRISTISDSDMLIVLDSGRVAEIGSPTTLLSKPGSIYGGMVRTSERSGSDVIAS